MTETKSTLSIVCNAIVCFVLLQMDNGTALELQGPKPVRAGHNLTAYYSQVSETSTRMHMKV